MSMKFIMETDLEKALPKTIGFNYAELKTALEASLQRYQGLIVTEDAIKEAKEDRAKLNALKKAIDAKRKEVKKRSLQPYEEDFEPKCKELVAMIDAPVLRIDQQIKDFDEKRKAEKMVEIENVYADSVSPTLKQIIPLSRIFDHKWLNKTVSLEKVKDEIIAIAKRTYADLIALDTVPEEYSAAVRSKYIETLDVSAALQHQQNLQAAAEAFREREAAKARKEPAEAQKPTQEPKTAENKDVYRLCLEFRVTKEQANMLKRFLVEHNIEHHKI